MSEWGERQRHMSGRAKRNGIAAAVARLPPPSYSVIAPQNPLHLIGPSAALATEPPPYTASEVGEYVAASLPGHCIDGWAYLGRSLSACLHGDAGTARHLAYYAEPRRHH